MKIIENLGPCSKVGRHVWYETDIGLVRKPIGWSVPVLFVPSVYAPIKKSWWGVLWALIRKWTRMLYKIICNK